MKIFWNPVATYLVSKTPDYVAPNTLTMIGFVHAIAPMVIMYCFCGMAMYGDLPLWFLILQFYCFLMYRMLDEMDGKQARKTGNSSPLGLIFDHGCDCFAAGISIICFGRALQVGNNILGQIYYIGLYSSFHFTTLEEYYTGILYLGPGNGVSDGCAVILIANLVTICIGSNNYWATPVFDITPYITINGVTVITLGQIAALSIGVLNCFLSSWK